MQMSETAFVITVYVLLIWFVVGNLLLAGLSFRDWIKSTLKQPKSGTPQQHHQAKDL
jgi:hypothetical protein